MGNEHSICSTEDVDWDAGWDAVDWDVAGNSDIGNDWRGASSDVPHTAGDVRCGPADDDLGVPRDAVRGVESTKPGCIYELV